jgi:hypothetical protein
MSFFLLAFTTTLTLPTLAAEADDVDETDLIWQTETSTVAKQICPCFVTRMRTFV